MFLGHSTASYGIVVAPSFEPICLGRKLDCHENLLAPPLSPYRHIHSPQKPDSPAAFLESRRGYAGGGFGPAAFSQPPRKSEKIPQPCEFPQPSEFGNMLSGQYALD
jgi:hypothetical protein